MASIPLIALQYRNPEQPDFLRQQAEATALRNQQEQAQFERQQRPLQMQQQQLQVQQQQTALKNQQAVTQGLLNWDGKDPAALSHSILQNGGTGDAALAASKHFLDIRKETAEAIKNEGQAALDKASAQQKQYEMMSGQLASFSNLPDEQVGQAVMQATQQWAQQGLLDQTHLQQAQALTQLPPQQMKQQLGLYAKGLLGYSEQIAAGQKEAQTAKDQAEAEKARLESEALKQSGGLTPAQAEGRYRTILQKQASGQPITPDETAFAVAYQRANQKTSTQSDTLGVTTSTTSAPSGFRGGRVGAAPAAAPGSTQTPSKGGGANKAQQSIVDAVGNYQVDPSTISRMFFRHPEIIGLVQEKYPDFDQYNYNARANMLKNYTSGAQSKEINAINTVAGHLDALDQAVTALNNGDVQGLNKIANSIGAQVGQTPQTTFQTIVHRVGPEITTAYITGGGGEAERLANEKDFSPSLSPQQLHSNIGATVGLLRSKIGALENQYKQTMGKDDFQQRFITPAAQQSFQRLSGAPQSGTFDWNAHPKVNQ